jgi:hypothetical protein
MPALTWDELRVVATESLSGDSGAGVRSTFVRQPGGAVFAVRNSTAETVAPNILMAESEVERLLDAGVLLATPPWPAKRGHVLLVRSATFARACKRVRHRSAFAWSAVGNGLEMAYVPLEASKAWEERCARDMLGWARDRLRGEPAGARLKEVEEVLLQGISLCDATSPEHHQLYVLLGVLLGKLDPARWPAVAENATLQIPDLAPATLEHEVAALRAELYWQEDLPSAPANAPPWPYKEAA